MMATHFGHDHPRRYAGAWEDLRQDIRIGLRTLRRQPGFALVAAATLALGIGASTTFFALIDAVLFKPLPYAQPAGLVHALGGPKGVYLALRDQSRTMDVAAYTPRTNVNLSVSGLPERVVASAVSGDLFTILGGVPRLGRTFQRGDDLTGREPLVVISHALWQQRFGGDAGVVGRTLRVDGTDRRIVGVMPAGFWFPSPDVRLWIPMSFDLTNPIDLWGQWHLYTIGRLRPGVSIGEAQAELRTVIPRIRTMFPWQMPETWEVDATIEPLHRVLAGDTRGRLLMLFASVLLVLVIACVNVANMLLARGVAQQRDFAVRSALGAGRGRLVRQALTETFTLAVLGGVAGVALAVAAVPLLAALLPADASRVTDVSIDSRALAFAVATVLATTGLSGLLPALVASMGIHTASKPWDRTHAGAPSLQRWISALVVGEVAMAVLLTIGAGALGSSFIRLLQVDPGFRTEGLLSMQVSLPEERCANPAWCRAFFTEALTRVRALPGVRGAAFVDRLPLADAATPQPFEPEGHPVTDAQTPPMFWWHAASAGYIETMGIRLIRGRTFDERDQTSNDPVVLVNESTARRFWPGQDPIGKRMRPFWLEHNWRTVVGVVADVRHRGLAADAEWEVYVPLGAGEAESSPVVTLVAATRTEREAIRQIVTSLAPDVAISRILPLDAVARASLGTPRATMQLLGTFAGLALFLGVVGVYGITSYRVTRLIPELAVRMAIGAEPRDIRRLILARTGTLAVSGLVIGLIGAFVALRVLSGQLYEVGAGVSATDPAVFIVVPIVLLSVVLIAAWIPARRAGRIDPVIALRGEQ